MNLLRKTVRGAVLGGIVGFTAPLFALMLPMIFVTLTLLQPSPLTLFGHTWTIPMDLADRPILVAAIMVTVGVAAAAGALRYMTFERYLA